MNKKIDLPPSVSCPLGDSSLRHLTSINAVQQSLTRLRLSQDRWVPTSQQHSNIDFSIFFPIFLIISMLGSNWFFFLPSDFDDHYVKVVGHRKIHCCRDFMIM